MKSLKNQRGSITVMALITMIVFTGILGSMYLIVSSKAQAQTEITEQIKDTYESQNATDIYYSYFGNSIIPIYTVDQLMNIGSGESIPINEVGGKIYSFAATDVTYILMNSLQIKESDYPDWIPIGDNSDITATFEGNNNTIKVEKENGTIIEYNVENGFSSSQILGYTMAEYIQANGTQYINTGFVPDQNIKIEVKHDLDLTAVGWVPIYGNIDVYFSNKVFSGTTLYANLYVKYGTRSTNYSNAASTGILVQDKNVFNLANGIIRTVTANNFTSITPIYIFNVCNTNGNPLYTYSNSYSRIYYFKIWHNEELVRDLVPCTRDEDGVVGMYDLVNRVFYENSGTGDFTCQ